MSDDIDIQNIAKLARVDLGDADTEEITANMKEVLSYVSSVEKVAGEAGEPEAGSVRNVLREDTDPHAPDAYREALLREAPSVDEDGFIVVPPILAR